MPIKTYKNIDECISYINDKGKPLAIYFYGKSNHADATKVSEQTSSGNFSTNECIVHSMSHYAGFGGVGESGTGRYGGFVGFENFSNRKGVLLKQATPIAIRSLGLPPFTDGKIKLFNRVAKIGCLMNQSDLAFYIKLMGLIIASVAVWYFFM